jgi:predicted DNA-binding ribbon-helix-helix protein
MGSFMTRRSLRIGEHEFTFSIEAHFWICFEDIARSQATTVEQLAQSIVATQTDDSLPSAIRTYVLQHFQRQSLVLETVDAVKSPAASMAAADTWIDAPRPRWLN